MKTKTMLWMASMVALMLLGGRVYAQSDLSGWAIYHIDLNKTTPSVDLKFINSECNTPNAFSAFSSELALNVATNVPTMGGSSAGDVNGTFVPSTRYADVQLLATNVPTMGG